jgi:hypothetical protein
MKRERGRVPRRFQQMELKARRWCQLTVASPPNASLAIEISKEEPAIT